MRSEAARRVRSGCTAALLFASMGLAAPAAAVALKGTVRNGTTGKPAAGDDYIALSVEAEKPTEIGRGKTDSAGRFQVTVAGKIPKTLVRVVHQGVVYATYAPPGATSVSVDVFDAAPKLEGMDAALDVRLQADGGMLEAIMEVTVRNLSRPPRSLVNDRSFEIELPAEAEIVAGAFQAPGRKAMKFVPAAAGQKGRYSFPFPLLPGESRYGVAYKLAYRDRALVEPKISFPITRLVVVHPKSMTFDGASAGLVFEARHDENWAVVRETASPKPGQSSAFRVSGTGSLAKVQVTPPGAEQAGTAPLSADLAASSHDGTNSGPAAPSHGETKVPGKGPRPPWDLRFLLGGLGAVLAAGAVGIVVYKRRHSRVALG